jgi:hypothetical protein
VGKKTAAIIIWMAIFTGWWRLVVSDVVSGLPFLLSLWTELRSLNSFVIRSQEI